MESVDQFYFSRVPWQVFATLTFQEARFRQGLGQAEVQRRFFRWLRWAADAGQVPFRRMLWIERREEGEIGHSWHLHALLGGLEESRVNFSFTHAAQNVWTSGIAKVRLVGDGGEVGYVLKGMNGADVYELRRFDSLRCHVVVAKSVWRLLRRRMLRSRKAWSKPRVPCAQSTGQLPSAPCASGQA